MKIVLAALLLGGLAFAQAAADNAESVAAAAKKSREAKASTAKKIYTDDDMPSTRQSPSTATPAGKPATNSSSMPSSDPVRDQKALDAEWQQRIRVQKERINSLEQQLRVAETNAARTANTYTYALTPNPDYARYKQQADSLREQLDAARKELEDLQDQAHRAGANKAYD